MQLKCSLSSLLGFILFFATILKSLNILQMAKPRRRSKWNFTFYDLSNAMCLELREKIQFKFFNCHLWYLVLVGMCCSDKPILWLSTRQFFYISFFSSIFHVSGPVECNFLVCVERRCKWLETCVSAIMMISEKQIRVRQQPRNYIEFLCWQSDKFIFPCKKRKNV